MELGTRPQNFKALLTRQEGCGPRGDSRGRRELTQSCQFPAPQWEQREDLEVRAGAVTLLTHLLPPALPTQACLLHVLCPNLPSASP